MARVTYKIFGARLGAQFSFDLAIDSESAGSLLRGRWRMSKAKGLGTLEPALAPGGKWQYRKFPAQGGYLFLHADGRHQDRVAGRRPRLRLA
jgi:hypothetical protein